MNEVSGRNVEREIFAYEGLTKHVSGDKLWIERNNLI